MKVTCPECAADVELPEDVVVNEVVSCPDCGLELEVCEVGGGKASVRALRVEGEDWGE